ncbi:MAG: glutamate--tRNA ligase [Ruminiclostridium sp.]|nr:glutamate--tRNA ligase [Ruminiclostridium sp.]
MDFNSLAELLFGDIRTTPEDIIAKYPRRNLDENAAVTRFAPSPTGYMHIGGLYATLISQKIAKQSGGLIYLRLEDTDKKREVAHGADEIINSLAGYGIIFDEGAAADGCPEKGNYGPYRQSNRREIYQTFAKELVRKGLAYPCFCTAEELDSLRTKQEELKLDDKGYYGEYAKCRNLTFEEIKANIEQGKEYVLRLRAQGEAGEKIFCNDIIRGRIEMPRNIMDVVLLKSDGIPTYHYAHAVDDFLMGTTHVIRGDEWISSFPIHQQLFEVSGFKMPKYAHIAPIMKLDDETKTKRKISKRKDPEASVSYYAKQGFPVKSVLEYLMTIANSAYEEWRMKSPDADMESFNFSLKKMSISGALFDMDKLYSVSREVISKMSEEELFCLISKWAKDNDEKLSAYIEKNEEKFRESIKLWKYNGKKARKDVAKWSDLIEMFPYLYSDEEITEYDFDEKISKEDTKQFIESYIAAYNHDTDNSQWFNDVKAIGEPLGFCPDIKAYKADPDSYKGSVADACTIIRVAVTGRRNTPDLYTIMQLIGKEETIARLKRAIEKL